MRPPSLCTGPLTSAPRRRTRSTSGTGCSARRTTPGSSVSSRRLSAFSGRRTRPARSHIEPRYSASLLDEAKRWFEAATTICRFVPDGGARSEKVRFPDGAPLLVISRLTPCGFCCRCRYRGCIRSCWPGTLADRRASLRSRRVASSCCALGILVPSLSPPCPRSDLFWIRFRTAVFPVVISRA